MEPRRILILSDGRPGHLNQSIAFARHLGYAYDICPVRFRWRGAKALSYLLDWCRCYPVALFETGEYASSAAAVVSAGSETYFANKALARKLGAKSVAIMLPKGYVYNFDLIVAQQHDNPPHRKNILCLPVNLSYVEPQGLAKPTPGKRVVSLIIGGDSRKSRLEADALRDQLPQVFNLFPEYDVWLTTSRRTSPELESVLREFDYAFSVYYSERQLNPIPDFLEHSEYVFITADSTSMISEAVSFGVAAVEILAIDPRTKDKKLYRFIKSLENEGCLHLFDGSCGEKRKKISVAHSLKLVVDRIYG